MTAGSDLSMTRVLALLGVAPVALFFLFMTLRVGYLSLRVRLGWTRVVAQVSEGSTPDTWILATAQGAREVAKTTGFSDLSAGGQVQLYQDPAHPEAFRRANFADLWLNTSILAFFTLMLGGIGLFMFQQQPELEFQNAKAQFEASLASSKPAPRPAPEDDGQPILLQEPPQSWKANIFWGLTLGLLMCVPAVLAPASTPPLKRYGILAGGVLWMTGMGVFALRNHGRKVQWQGETLVVSSVFGNQRIPVREVVSLERHDAKQELSDLENIGRSRYKNRPLDTRPTMIVYELKDARGWTLLRLDKDMQPPEAMAAFLRRMEHRLRKDTLLPGNGDARLPQDPMPVQGMTSSPDHRSTHP